MPKRDFEEPMALGAGFDAVSGEVRGDCVLRTESSEPGVGRGQEITFKLVQFTDTLQLSNSLDVSASASMKADFLGSGSAKAKFVATQKTNSYSIYLLVRILVTNPTKLLRDVLLKEEARNLLARGQNEEFRQRCGDEFIVGVTTGGEFNAVIEVKTQSEEEKRQVSAKVRASGATYQVGADFAQAVNKLSEKNELSIFLLQRGGNETRVPITIDEMINRAVNFPSSVQGDNAYNFSALFQSYETILNLPPTPNFIDVQHQKDVLEKLSSYRMKCLDTISDIEYILDNHDQFENFDSTELTNRINETNKFLDNIKTSATACLNDYGVCKLPDNVIDMTSPLPKRQVSLPLPPGKLGRKWLEQEAGWTGVWTRRGDTNVFDAVWTKDGSQVTAVLQILIDGDNVQVSRTQDSGGNICTYQGKIQPDGITVIGTYHCTVGTSDWKWQAVIQQTS